MNYDIVTIRYDRLLNDKETDKAWCFLIDGKPVYMPKSQVEDIRETANEFDSPKWIIESKGLEGYII